MRPGHALGALQVSQALLPHLRRGTGKKLAYVSSVLGSIRNTAPDHLGPTRTGYEGSRVTWYASTPLRVRQRGSTSSGMPLAARAATAWSTALPTERRLPSAR